MHNSISKQERKGTIMGQLIVSKNIQQELKTDGAARQAVESLPELPKPLLPLWQSGFLSAHHTSSEVKAMLSRTGNLLAHI